MLMQRLLAFCLLSWLLPAERFAWADARPLHHLRGLGMPGAQPAGSIVCCQPDLAILHRRMRHRCKLPVCQCTTQLLMMRP